MSIFTVTPELLDEVSALAKKAQRRRTNHNFHQLEDPVQRFLNAIEPDSYIQPHRHSSPPKEELFFVLRGRAAIVEFSEAGEITKVLGLDPSKAHLVVEVPAGAWHTIISLEVSSVFLEVKKGPYEPTTDKDFADWAPTEADPESATYLNQLKHQILKLLP
ncbi:MAG: WbuC family cupin fold metalloprotein [SAR324 cluster bacterium]|nr:WbuC family cupin fold metalloprotein [SAR324 cluster bacterium]